MRSATISTSLPNVPKPPLDPGLIDRAPLAPDSIPAAAGEGDYFAAFVRASSELQEANAELVRIRAKKTVDDVRAQMLEGYANRVFWFVVAYCLAVGAMLLISGFKRVSGFELADTILGIIAGSTAVSVIGLIGMVITGLFGSAPRAQASDKRKP